MKGLSVNTIVLIVILAFVNFGFAVKMTLYDTKRLQKNLRLLSKNKVNN